MIKHRPTLLSLALVAALAACGGGEPMRETASTEFQAALVSQKAAQSPQLRALAGVRETTTISAMVSPAAQTITAGQFFQVAEALLAELFPTQVAPTPINDLAAGGLVFQVRAYANGNFLAVASDGKVYGLGPYTGDALKDFGTLQSFAELVCSQITCGTPGGGTGPVGPLNGCTEGASSSLQAGRSYNAVYISSVLVAPASTGEYTVRAQVDGTTTFEGQQAVKVTTNTSGFQFGQNVDATILSYHQVAEHDLTRTLGTDVSASISGFTTTTRVVFTAPASLNNEYSLALGSSLTKTEAFTTSTIITGLPSQLPPTSGSSTSNYTYEARENVTVPAGSFSTCRYKSTSDDGSGSVTFWFIVGSGLVAKMESRSAAGTVETRAELKTTTLRR